MQNWLLDQCSFVCIKISLTSLVLQYKIQKNTLSQANINPAAIFALGPLASSDNDNDYADKAKKI